MKAEDEVTGWALAAAGGDQVAAAAFVRATQAEVWRFVAALVDTGAADDLTQETYLRAFRALPTFQGRASARTWLFGIAKRTCADHLRAVVRRRRLSDRMAQHAAIDADTTADTSAALGSTQLVTSLPEPRRTAFVLTQLLGLSYAEAAEVADCAVGTIRSRVARARTDLIEAVRQARSA